MITTDPVLVSLHLYGSKPVLITMWTFIGLVANVLFTARVIIQWVASEKQKKSIAPVTFWWASLFATIIMIFYSIQRTNVPFLLGYSLNVLPYTRNLMLIYSAKRSWHIVSYVVPIAIFLGAIIFATSVHFDSRWLTLGLIGNAVWSTRFIPQWIYSERKRQSVLPMWFWIWSLIGQMLCLAFALLEYDFVFILGFMFNGIPIVRNIMLSRNHAEGDSVHE